MSWDRLDKVVAPRNGAARQWELVEPDAERKPKTPRTPAQDAQRQAPMNSRAWTVDQTVEAARERKFTAEQSEYRDQVLVPEDDETPRCATCTFFEDEGRCRVVDGGVTPSSVCDFRIPSADASRSAADPVTDPGSRRLELVRRDAAQDRTAAEPPAPVMVSLSPEAMALVTHVTDVMAQAVAALTALDRPRGADLERLVIEARAAFTALESRLGDLASAVRHLSRPRTVVKEVQRDPRQNISKVVETHRIEDEGA